MESNTLLDIAKSVKYRLIKNGLDINYSTITEELNYVDDELYSYIISENLSSNDVSKIISLLLEDKKYYFKIVSSFDPTDVIYDSFEYNEAYLDYASADECGNIEFNIRNLNPYQYYVNVFEK
jgi:hypothetical protein